MNTLDNEFYSDISACGQDDHKEPISMQRQLHGDGSSDASPPRTVIRGESSSSSLSTTQIAVSTDWVDFTFPLEDSDQEINRFFRDFIELTGECFAPLASRGKGFNGWQRSYSLGNSKGVFAIGGQRGRATLSLSGQACTHIRHDGWPDIVSLIRDEYQGRMTRWDGAADDYQGIHSIEWALEQYKSRGFKSGGNRPRVTTHGDWINNEGRGRTLELGSRKNGKLVRVYEKGNQLGDPSLPLGFAGSWRYTERIERSRGMFCTTLVLTLLEPTLAWAGFTVKLPASKHSRTLLPLGMTP